jgi:hypothetical protein
MSYDANTYFKFKLAKFSHNTIRLVAHTLNYESICINAPPVRRASYMVGENDEGSRLPRDWSFMEFFFLDFLIFKQITLHFHRIDFQ